MLNTVAIVKPTIVSHNISPEMLGVQYSSDIIIVNISPEILGVQYSSDILIVNISPEILGVQYSSDILIVMAVALLYNTKGQCHHYLIHRQYDFYVTNQMSQLYHNQSSHQRGSLVVECSLRVTAL